MKNRLANSTSPYLLQHATNPVDWYPWGEEALNKAKKEDKPIIVSIGYSSCHWCHVMAHESFEDSTTAAIMNEHFINIKVDREERPDVDQIYMDAVNKMGLDGGWPLNVFLTPDQKPFYGGTYFPNEGWKKLLISIKDAFKDKRAEIDKSAEQFAQALGQSQLAQYTLEETDFSFTQDQMDSVFTNLSERFDPKHGGMNKSPKFPMPSIWEMLANYHTLSGNKDAIKHLTLTLEKIANGGIYDQVGGGFSRYSVDGEWLVPHFEKMLYDNGQLLSLYANAYKLTGKEQFRQVLVETVEWLEREMLDGSGGFYSALDADSDGEEGKFYVWTNNEIKAFTGDNYKLISAYYDVSSWGNWEEKNVLRKLKTDEEILEKFELSPEEFAGIISDFKARALAEREKRIRPGLDSKIIAGWNGLALSGLCNAYQATGNEKFLTLAASNVKYLSSLITKGKLRRFPNSDLEGFLEDYSAVIQSFITYYETTFDPEYLEMAQVLTDRVMEGFFDEKEGFFFFTGDSSEKLIARKKEVFDNVIPSSNSIMAWNLFHLGTHLYNDEYTTLAKEMTAKIVKLIPQEPEYLSNWASLAFQMSNSFAEIVILGPDYKEFAAEISKQYLPGKIITAANKENDRPMFELKSLRGGETTVFVCYNRSCKLPVNSVEEALEQLN
ncbi:MAG: thioredoxin domain-containing protein [Cytophagales bacterium]|nr:thioredoxin domain-containing protein [Cytophagales bacterium]